MTALPNLGSARREGDRSRSPKCFISDAFFATRNTAVRNDRPPGSPVGTSGGRPFPVAEMFRIGCILRHTQHGGQE
jgi:hypothetical protein